MKKSILSIAVMLFSTWALADDSSNMHWAGFLSQSLVKTSAGVKLSGNSDGKYGSIERTEIGALACYTASSNVDIRGMLSITRDGDIDNELRLNYGIVDVHTDSGMHGIRLGRYSYDYGFYNAARNNPMYRDMELPAQGMYRDGFKYMTRSGDGLQAYTKFHLNADYSVEFDAGYGKPVLYPQKDIVQSFVMDKNAGEFTQDSTVISFNTTLDNRSHGVVLKLGYLIMDYKFSTPLIDAGHAFPMKAHNYYAGARKYFTFGDFTLEFMQTHMGHTKWDDLAPLPNYVWGGVRGTNMTYKHYVTEQISLTIGYDTWQVNKADSRGKNMEHESHGTVPAGAMYHNSKNFGISYREQNYTIRAELHVVHGTNTIKQEGNDLLSSAQPQKYNIFILSGTYKF